MVKREWSLEELQSKAEAYCAVAEHCLQEVRGKLYDWGASPDQIEGILAHLLDTSYIDEARYCRAYVHDKVNYQGWGRLKIIAQLRMKGLSSEHINTVLEQIDMQEYMAVLQRVADSKRRTLRSTDTHAREKLLRFCLQRGFTYEEIESLGI